MDLSADQRQRYHRQLLLPQFGPEGQAKLQRGRVLVVGAGGLGSPAALYLAAAGIGTLGIVDSDVVDLSNLHRQILHATADIGRSKAQSAKEKLAALNPDVAVVTYTDRLADDNAEALVRDYDIVLGCVDNFTARYAINRACVKLGKPNVFGAAARFEGQASVFCLPDGPCYQCVFQEPPPEDWRPGPEDQAVLGTTPGTIGCIQATEAIKLLAGFGKPLSGRLLLYDGLNMRFREIAVRKNPNCPVCGNGKTEDMHAGK